MLSRSSFSFLYGRHFDVLYYLGHMFRPLDFFYVIHIMTFGLPFPEWVVTIMVSEQKFRPMVNTRTDAELAAAVQAAVDAMLPQIREQVREEYRTGAVASGSNPPPVTIQILA
ncbi:hypothetical protein Tco_1541747 [Tanacetum coccineum]